ncbi:MAG TPA: nicotinate-nucleotide--dimethylbenzimidazole phosphoribosyltransferase [Salinivirgaceae bacterium]|nr:nicotinate-nucleotide--dimethylbenzimidazole phosphoribosyltransferase [Salinivirgaceae bacterium]
MILNKLQEKIDLKTKPLGSLGYLEKLALQIGTIQNTLTPNLQKPTIVVFAADHGIAKEGVSAYPSEVTYQMVKNILNRGAAINVFCQQNNIDIQLVDAGVNFDFCDYNSLINAKIAKGTNNFLYQKAMTEQQLEQCFHYGEKIIDQLFTSNCNVVGFGELGIGNTSSAAMLMSCLCGLPLEDCVGKGTGHTDQHIQKKLAILEQAKRFHGEITDIKEVVMTFAGFEIAQISAAIIQAHKRNMLILIDGFTITTAFLIAYKINPNVIKNAIFCHVSREKGHRKLLDYLKVEALLNLGLRVGEGTGCAVAYPIIVSAVEFLNNMASFESANVSNRLR